MNGYEVGFGVTPSDQYDLLAQFVRTHYAPQLQQNVYNKLYARNFQVPGEGNPLTRAQLRVPAQRYRRRKRRPPAPFPTIAPVPGSTIIPG
jgi:hypothetical protein